MQGLAYINAVTCKKQNRSIIYTTGFLIISYIFLKGLSSENKGGSNYTSADLSCLGLWSRRYSFARNTAAILKSAKNISE
jgi:hypothetical protein